LEAEVFDALDARILHKGHPSWIEEGSARLRQALVDQLGRGLENQPQLHALLSSMVLGLQPGDLGLSHWREAFRTTGTLHLFAVSGLNLSLLAALLGWGLQGFPGSERRSAAAIALLLLLYAGATGWSVSCLRALLMACLLLGRCLVARPVSPLNSLGAAALLLLLWDTNTLFDWGFQLSFALVLALILLTPSVARHLLRPALPDPLLPKPLWSPFQRGRVSIANWGTQALAANFTAWLACLPWAVLAFEQISLIALLTNLLAAPIAFFNLTLGFAAIGCAPLGPITPWLNQCNAHGASLLVDWVQWSSRVPAAALPIRWFKKAPLFAALDLQGSPCLLLHTGTASVLLDCGSRHQTAHTVLPALRHFGVQSLDALILCRPAADSIGGALDLFEQIPVGRVLDSSLKSSSKTRKDLHQWLGALHQPISKLSAGDCLPLGKDARIEVLYPPREAAGPLADDKGLVLRVCLPQAVLLYTGAAGFPTERWLLEHCRNQLPADVWIRGSHSRDPTGCPEFVEAVHPRAILVAQPSWRKKTPVNSEFSTPLKRPQSADAEDLPEPSPSLSNPGIARDIPVFLQARCGAVLGEMKRQQFRIRGYRSSQSLQWSLPSPPKADP
jgi:competence protein ComEC